MDNERRRLSRQLHDSVNPKLIFAKLQLQQLHRQLEKQDANAFSECESVFSSAMSSIDEAYCECRKIIKTTRIEVLDTLGIIRAIEELIDSYKGIAKGVSFRFDYAGIELGEIPETISVNVYRIIQEALLNIIKHANANRVAISIRQEKIDSYAVSISDNGAGMQASKQFGIGMIDMRERAEILGGKLKVETKESGGVTISFFFSATSNPSLSTHI